MIALQAASLGAQTSYNVRTLVGAGVTSYVPKLPYGIAIEPSGTVVFSDKAQVMRLDPRTGSVTVVAGTGEEGFSGDGGPAQSAKLRSAYDLAVDAVGNIYVADAQDSRIRRIDASSGVISTFAGTGEFGFSGDGGTAASAKLNFPRGLGYDPTGALLIADTDNYRLRRVDLQTGSITTLVGGGTQDTGAANQVSVCRPLDAIVAANGDVFISEGGCGGVVRFSPSNGQVTVYVNESRQRSFFDDATIDLPARDFRFNVPNSLEFDLDGNLLVADVRYGGVFRVDGDTRIVRRVAGTGSSSDAPDATAALNRPVVASGIALAPSGVLYTAGYLPVTTVARIEQLTPLRAGDATQILIRTVSGEGTVGLAPQGTPCGANCWQFPVGTTVTLTVRPNTGSIFLSWGGGCSGTQTTCVVRPGVTRPVNLFFDSPVNVALEKLGTGAGSISTNPATAICTDRCVVGVLATTTVQYIATPAPGSRFAGWEGFCAGVTETTCTRALNQLSTLTERVVRARFELIGAKLRIEFFGTGTGRVNIVTPRAAVLKSCISTCVVELDGGDLIHLQPDWGPANASAFSAWRSCTNSTEPVYDGFSMIVGTISCVGVGFYVSRITSIERIAFTGLTAANGSFIDANGPLWTSADGGLMVGAKSSNGPNRPYTFTQLRTPGTGYRVLRHLDLNGDVWNDVIFQKIDQTDGFGPISAWLKYQSTQLTPMRNVRLNWQVQASGDLDGDGFGDLVWRYLEPGSNDTGVSYIWFMRNGEVEQVRKRGGAPLNWTLLGALDINRDAADELFYLSPTGDIRVLMATAARTCANVSGGRVPTGFLPLSVGRFTGDGIGGEVLVRDPSTGELGVVQISGFGVDLPGAGANPDDPNASCTSTTTVLQNSFKRFLVTGLDWTYLGKDKGSDGISTDVVLFMRPDRQIMRLENPLNDAGGVATRYVEAGQVPAGYRMVNR
jgi:sugar lactone lactonase YvrE